MIDLKSLFQKHLDCISDANRFRSLLNDLYPNERARTNVLVTILTSGIGREIQNGKSDYLSLCDFAKRLENEYGFASDLCDECLEQWAIAFDDSVLPASKGLLIIAGVVINGSLCTDKDIVIPRGVTSIGRKAFCDHKELRKVIIPDGVTSIDDCAFKNCTSLESISIPNSVKIIGESAFEDCWNLKDIEIPAGVTTIGRDAFRSCMHALTSVTIPNSVTSIGNNAFSLCFNLTSVTISNGVKSIGECAFESCHLTSVKIPGSARYIEDATFSGCCDLKSVEISDGVTSIGEAAFYNCKSLTSITIPPSLISIGSNSSDYYQELYILRLKQIKKAN